MGFRKSGFLILSGKILFWKWQVKKLTAPTFLKRQKLFCQMEI